MSEKISLAGLTPEEISSSLQLKPAFRAKQVYEWIAKGVESFDQMTNIDKATREKLDSSALLRSSSVSQVLRDPDGTIKLQITLNDGRVLKSSPYEPKGDHNADVTIQDLVEKAHKINELYAPKEMVDEFVYAVLNNRR